MDSSISITASRTGIGATGPAPAAATPTTGVMPVAGSPKAVVVVTEQEQGTPKAIEHWDLSLTRLIGDAIYPKSIKQNLSLENEPARYSMQAEAGGSYLKTAGLVVLTAFTILFGAIEALAKVSLMPLFAAAGIAQYLLEHCFGEWDHNIGVELINSIGNTMDDIEDLFIAGVVKPEADPAAVTTEAQPQFVGVNQPVAEDDGAPVSTPPPAESMEDDRGTPQIPAPTGDGK